MFLTVLCVLSFTGNGLMIMGAAIALVWWKLFLPFLNFALEQEGVDLENPEFMGPFGPKFMSLFDQIPLIYSIMFGAAIINILGVILMWKLKRTGFYIYAVTELIPPVANLIIFTMAIGVLGLGLSLFNFIIPVAFVIMYGLNLKHMK